MVETKVGPDAAFQFRVLKQLSDAPVHDAIGICCSYLLLVSELHPDVLRRVLNEPVHKEGFRGISLLRHLTRVCR